MGLELPANCEDMLGEAGGVTTARPGFGAPHEGFASLLATRTPASEEEVAWANGTARFRVAVHLTGIDGIPDALISSARCIVRIGDGVLLCTNADGISHVLPGGRREEGESPGDAAIREVHEETGWLLDRSTIREVGWLHFRYRTPVAAEFQRYPHPDFVHVVYMAEATERDASQGGAWSDTEGYVIDSRVVTVEEASEAVAELLLDHTLLQAAVRRHR